MKDFDVVCDVTNNSEKDVEDGKFNLGINAPRDSPLGRMIRRHQFVKALSALYQEFGVVLDVDGGQITVECTEETGLPQMSAALSGDKNLRVELNLVLKRSSP